MPYIERSLGEGERLIGRAHFHWLYNFASWLALIAAGTIAAVLLAMADNADETAFQIAAAAIFAAGLLIFLRRMIRKWTTELGVTSHRFVKKTGWLSLRTDEIALPNIEGVRIFQGFLGRVFNYGQIRIEGTGVDAVTLPTIADPIGFRRAIETARGIKA